MSQSRTPHILVFDSGVGGLSILAEIQQQYPHCQFSYCSDNALFPYGTKAEPVLIERVDKVLHHLQQITKADIIVVACNTASTVALPTIRQRFSLPVVGVVPAIKPAAKLSASKVIGLLATPGTIQRPYTLELINNFANDCEVISVGSSELVQLAEQKLRGETITSDLLLPIVQPFLDNKDIDSVVLACTHFPLLKQELQNVLPAIQHWVDSGDAIARRVGHWIEQLGLPLSGLPRGNHIAYFTQASKEVDQLQTALSQFELSETVIEKVS